MKKGPWAKLVVLVLLICGIAVGLCVRWGPVRRGSDPLSNWGRGNPTLSERTYYVSRINRIVEKWERTRSTAEMERDGHFANSYRTLLVIDLDKQAIWIEDCGRIGKNDYAQLPPGMKWKLQHLTPQSTEELSGRIPLKMRGAYSRQQPLEHFFLIGTGRDTGHYNFQFHSTGGTGDYNSGPFRPQGLDWRSSDKSEDSYGSILVTDSEYEQYQTDDSNPAVQASSAIEEKHANWLRAEKALYGQIERHVRKAGFELQRLTVEPGPDFSAGHAEIRGRNDTVLRELFGGYSSMETYLKIDYLGNDVWYAKSARHPQRPVMPRRTVDLEFLVHATAEITDSQRDDLLVRGRNLQQSEPIAPSKWKVTLENGTTVEFIGICENPSAGKQWWGPDGSPLEYTPYINTEPFGRPGDDRKLYELAWWIRHSGQGLAVSHSFEGSRGSYSRQIRDRYGNRVIQGVSADGCSFDKSRRKTTWNVGLAAGDWQTALVVEDKAAEMRFLGRQRIILNPPRIEGGKIIVSCFEDHNSYIEDYQKDFAVMLWEDSASKTVSLNRYPEEVSNDRRAGLTEHQFTLEDVSMSQIEGVCFRYRPYHSVKFKNISLVSGEDQGFEIELGQQTGER